jgi:hypothetical protein
MATTDITAAFLPLTDSAIFVAARECGFAEEEDIALSLLRETSWANIRDRMAIGQFEAAHMLAPMPIAFALGLTPLALDVVVPMAMGGRTAGEIAAMLIGRGLPADTPVVVAKAVSRPGQKHWRGALADLPAAMPDIGYDEPVLIGVGQVFAVRTALSFATSREALAAAI